MWLTAFKSCLMQQYKMMTRYIFNTISGVVTLYIVFALLFYGTKTVGGGAMNLGDTLEAVFAGYVTWMIAMMGSTDLAWQITNQAQTGTFEQLYLSPLGYRWIAAFTQTLNFVFNVTLVGVLTVIMSLTTGQRVHLDLLSIVPVALAIFAQASGIGFALAGLALIYKRIQSFFQIVQFAMVGLFMLPFSAFPLAKYLPLTMGRFILQEVLMKGTRLWEVGWSNIGPMLAATVLWMAIGLFAFAVAEDKAREKGLLGQY